MLEFKALLLSQGMHGMVSQVEGLSKALKLKYKHPEAKIIAHPECPENILNHSDFIGSTSALLKFISTNSFPELISE